MPFVVQSSAQTSANLPLDSSMALNRPAQLTAMLVEDPELGELVRQDLKTGLKAIDVPLKVADQIINCLKDGVNGINKAREVVAPYRDPFYKHFQGRSLKLANVLKDPISQNQSNSSSTELFDWGTGDTQVAGAIQNIFPELKVKGGDILPYYEGSPFVPFYKIENNKVPAIADASQAFVTLNYVLHHAMNSIEVLHEVERILAPGGCAIVIELIPQGQDAAAVNFDLHRLWLSDFLFCVVWHKDDGIPMPGKYRTVSAWEDQAKEAGLELISEKSIKGTPVIYCDSDNGRKLMVFQKQN